MARVKATTTDIHARLARGECANYRAGSCLGKHPCTVTNGEACDYFASYVLPLLEYPDFAGKYAREAKITVALNPQSKVVHKRRQAATASTLALDAGKTAKATTSAPPVLKKLASLTETRTPAKRIEKAAPARREKAVLPTLALDNSKAAQAEAPSLISVRLPLPVHDTPSSLLSPITASRPKEQAITTVVSLSGDVHSKPRRDLPPPAPMPEQPQLLLELCPPDDSKRKSQRKRF